MECQELDQSASPGAYGTKKNFIMRLTENCVLKKWLGASAPQNVFCGTLRVPGSLGEGRHT